LNLFFDVIGTTWYSLCNSDEHQSAIAKNNFEVNGPETKLTVNPILRKE